MKNREDTIYLEILEIIEQEFEIQEALKTKKLMLNEDVHLYKNKKEISQEEIKKYFGDYKDFKELKKKGINYYKKLPKKIREYIKHANKEVRQAIGFAMLGKPVKILTGKEFQKDGVKLTVKVPKHYKEKYGGKVINKELGEVYLDLEGVKDDISHKLGSVKASAFVSVPEVIMNGKIFDRQKNWKGRGWDTFVIIAPIKIGTKRYIEEVIVKKVPVRQGLYLHETEIKMKLENFIQTHTKGVNSLTSKLIIAQKLENVKRKKDKRK